MNFSAVEDAIFSRLKDIELVNIYHVLQLDKWEYKDFIQAFGIDISDDPLIKIKFFFAIRSLTDEQFRLFKSDMDTLYETLTEDQAESFNQLIPQVEFDLQKIESIYNLASRQSRLASGFRNKYGT